MSGGVDSSVAAWMLKQQGFEVIGLFMKNWEDDDTDEYCTSREDLVDAAAVADVLGIELEAVNFAAEYRERVFAQFLREYEAGRTPNPDVLCNSEIKFRAFLDHARALGADHIATGHYARVRRATACARRAAEGRATRRKDQSYFLHRLTQEQLAPVLFPLGEIAQARRARDRAARGHPDVGEEGFDRASASSASGRFAIFSRDTCRARPGRSRRPRAASSGATTGSRTTRSASGRAWASAGRATASDAPWFVAGKDRARNALIVVQGHEHPLLYRRDGRRAWTCTGSRAARPALPCSRASARRRDTGCPMRRARVELRDDGGASRGIRRAAVGADARPVSRALRRRRVPGRRRDRARPASGCEPLRERR